MNEKTKYSHLSIRSTIHVFLHALFAHSSVNPFFMTTFMHSFIYLSIPYIHLSSILPFIYLSIHSSIHSSINLFLTLIYSSIFLFTIHIFHPYIYPFIHLFIFTFIHSFIYLFFSFIPPFIHYCVSSQNLEETHALSAQRKAVLDELWEKFRKETEQYKESTEEKKMRFEALKKKDEINAKDIAKQMKRLNKLQVSYVV